ncbi:uncharacterized protein F4812DRAFT_455625 [Daldinia caldariorum]|uniref:uncharacterized protein n=1 Tax=Daldinia caldariorum TaxID=326644 RepID=UPI00200880AF|nr:uncharacterized protein F4812DRAFT_455625 [Daldinia caldariorum]KAI1471511.1 hypothetical protein F4812DRAFT_455625 [Daldinia caldariorum]
MFSTLVRRTALRAPISLNVRNASTKPLRELYNNPYKPKKIWPPDFSKLSEKEKFRFERRYKRRVKLATARPRWDKFIRLVQLFSVTTVLVYAVLFMEWESENQPFKEIRDKFWNTLGAFSPEKRYERRVPDMLPVPNSK